MKNWNTDITKFKSPKAKRLWELSQIINYGLDGKKLSEKELKQYWPDLKPLVDEKRARMIEYLLWKKVSSQKTNRTFWGLSSKTNS